MIKVECVAVKFYFTGVDADLTHRKKHRGLHRKNCKSVRAAPRFFERNSADRVRAHADEDASQAVWGSRSDAGYEPVQDPASVNSIRKAHFSASEA